MDKFKTYLNRQNIAIEAHPIDPKKFSPGVEAKTDGISQIYYRASLEEIEKKCALMHELIHIEEGHIIKQNEEKEQKVKLKTATTLIKINDFDGSSYVDSTTGSLEYEILAGRSFKDLAISLYVTQEVFRDWLDLYYIPKILENSFLVDTFTGSRKNVKKTFCFLDNKNEETDLFLESITVEDLAKGKLLEKEFASKNMRKKAIKPSRISLKRRPKTIFA